MGTTSHAATNPLRQYERSFTADTVAKALLEYYKLGATSLLIRGYDPRPDAVQYGEELIPRVRALK